VTENREPEVQPLDFYISYASPDRMWAEWVDAQLKQVGYTCVLDWLPGDNIILAREDALQRADRVLAICSAAYFGEGFSTQEWTAVIADRHRKAGRLIPIWIEDVEGKELPSLLRVVQPIKLFDISDADARKQLLSGLASDRRPSNSPPFPGSAPPVEASPDVRLPGVTQPEVSHVPPRNPGFTGRDRLLLDVRETLLRSTTGLVVLQGPGGVGKTQSSIEYAYRFSSDYDIVWTINAEQPELVVSQLAELSIALGAATATTDAQIAAAAALRALRDKQRWLLIFDNVEDADHLTTVLPNGKGHVLVTTRVDMWQEIGDVLPVEEFTRPEATSLLTSRVAALTPADADQLAEALGDLPLALAQAAGVLQPGGLPSVEFQRLLASQATEVLSKGKPRSYPTSLAATTLVTLDKLTSSDPMAANLLRLCGYLAPEYIPAAWFYDLSALDLTDQIGAIPTGTWEVSDAFEHIRDMGLGRVDQKGLKLHRLTQAILRDHTSDLQTSYRYRVAAVLSDAAPGSSDDPATWPAWSAIIPHLLSANFENAPAALRPLACAAARYLLHSGQARAALTLADRLHSILAAELGPDDLDSLNAAQFFAHALHDTGESAKGLELQQDTRERRRLILGEDHPDTLNSSNDLAAGLDRVGRYEESLALIQDTYNRRRRVLGDDHPDTLKSAGNLAGTLRDLGRYKEALTLNQDTYNRHRRVLGDDHPDTLTSAGNVAASLHDLGRYKEALALKEDAYDRQRRLLGEDHPDTLRAAGHLAGTLHNLGRYKEALALSQDAYDRQRRLLGDDHPDTLRAAGNLAATLHNLGRYKEALALKEDAYDRHRRLLGDDHPGTLRAADNLAGSLHDLGRYKEALALSQDTYDRHRRLLGDDHPNTLRAAGNLAPSLHNLGRYKEALTLSRDAYDRQRRLLGDDHPDTLASAVNLAATLHALARHKEALLLHQAAYERRRQLLGENHPDTIKSAHSLVANLEALGRRSEAMAIKVRIPRKRKKRK
jgi:TIR domain/Tetratricopeptide repeat/NB-ARC domain